MDECIKREDAIRVVKKYFTDFLGLNPDICIDGIRSLPDADVVERKKGKWIHFSRSDECSVCGYDTGKYEAPTWFCPKCGADMR